jgi:alpha-ketoglutaric semialdehyde dehydrogenase
MTKTVPVLIGGQWRASQGSASFQAENPATKEKLDPVYPISVWADCDEALRAAAEAAEALRVLPAERFAQFLESFADRIEKRKDALVETAHAETALPKTPRLADVELPRTTNQLRQAAAAARDGSWTMPTIDSKNNIRSCYGPIGPVCVFGPNNFPFAFGSASGGDFAAAVAAGNPVIAKANSSHPGTTKLFAEEAFAAVQETGLPLATVQLIYRTGHSDGERLVSDARVGATGYTGSRSAGLKLKSAADAAGKPIYLELSSVNPVVILPGALQERGEKLAEEFTTSCLMGTGQFCTNPGLLLMLRGELTDEFVTRAATRFQQAPVGTLHSAGVQQNLEQNLATLRKSGAETVAGDQPANGKGYCFPNTLLRVSGEQFLRQPHALQSEAFGNASLVVIANDVDEACGIIDQFEGNLTGSLYSHSAGQDDDLYDRLASHLRTRVGRLLNDKMPTGVAVSPAMNHGGPFPATGHPGFTAVGIPASLIRFAMLQCYDNVREHRLPAGLRNENPTGKMWRLIDGQWSQKSIE